MMQCKSCLNQIPENLCDAHAQLSHNGFAVFYPYVKPTGEEIVSKLNISIDNHGQEYAVSEMRRRLAQVLSKLDGAQKVTFSFRAELAEYKPAKWDRIKTFGGNLRENLIQMTSGGEDILTPYAHLDWSENPVAKVAGHVKTPTSVEFDTAIYGELARPEND